MCFTVGEGIWNIELLAGKSCPNAVLRQFPLSNREQERTNPKPLVMECHLSY